MPGPAVDFKTYNNNWYKKEIGASKAKQILWYFTNIIFFIWPIFPFTKLKCSLLRLFGADVGKSVIIKPSVNIKYPWKLTIGDYTWIGEKTWIDNLGRIVIGANVCLSQGAMLLTGNHDFTKTTFNLVVKEINIEDGVWIGAKAIVCPGITCHSHSVLAAGSVATKNLAAWTINQGNPAQQIKSRVIT